MPTPRKYLTEDEKRAARVRWAQERKVRLAQQKAASGLRRYERRQTLCSECGEPGHNRARCPDDRPIPKAKPYRGPRLELNFDFREQFPAIVAYVLSDRGTPQQLRELVRYVANA